MRDARIIVMGGVAACFERDRNTQVDEIENAGSKPEKTDAGILPPNSRLSPCIDGKQNEGPRKGEEDAFGPEVGIAEATPHVDDDRHRDAMQNRADDGNARTRWSLLNLPIFHLMAFMEGAQRRPG